MGNENPKSKIRNLNVLLHLTLLLLVAGGCARQTKRQLQGEVTEPKVKVGRIAFEGNRTFPTKLLKSRLRLKEGAEFDDFLFQEDKRKLKGFYRRNGFLEMKLSTRSKIDYKTGKLDHTFVIAEGVQTRTRSVSVEVRPQLAGVTDDDLFGVITLQAKEPLNMTAVDLSRYAILSLYADKGYLYAASDTIIVRDTVAHEADVTFTIQEGHQVRVGTLDIRYSAIDSNAPPPKPRSGGGSSSANSPFIPGTSSRPRSFTSPSSGFTPRGFSGT